MVGVVESFFVGKAYRKSGAGLRLLHEAEKYALKNNLPGLLVSAPFGGDLAVVLPHVGYIETNRVFFRKTKYE
jgi:GNAT superfamily N-acetyltransferase